MRFFTSRRQAPAIRRGVDSTPHRSERFRGGGQECAVVLTPRTDRKSSFRQDGPNAFNVVLRRSPRNEFDLACRPGQPHILTRLHGTVRCRCGVESTPSSDRRACRRR